MKNHIIQKPDFKKISWELTNYCNYSCSYCTPELNGGTVPLPKSYDNIIELVKKFRGNEPMLFDIMGGEPTLWPLFEEFCYALRDTSTADTMIIFSTNASRTMRWWKQFKAPVTEVGLSFHPEEATVEHFVDVIEEIQDKYHVVLWIMAPPGKLQKKSWKLFNMCKKNEYRVKAVMKPVMDWYNGSGMISGYTEKGLEKIKKHGTYKHSQYRSCAINNELYYNGKVTDLRYIINNKMNGFKGWKCKVGMQNLYIKASGEIYGSACGIKESYIGNLETGFELKTEPVVCTKRWCTCGTDIEIEKWNTNTLE
jgi:MoaA/NifB/PqqE/SkfB family radical SAM enzyme